jgi:hypothetical protein
LEIPGSLTSPVNQGVTSKISAIRYVLWVYTNGHEYDSEVEGAVGRRSDGGGMGPEGRDMDFWFDSPEEAQEAEARVIAAGVGGLITTEIKPYMEDEDLPDTLPWGEAEQEYYRVAAFDNGQIVRARTLMSGIDDRGDTHLVPKGTKGEVLWSDDNISIVIFTLESPALGPHLVRVQEATENFGPATGNPFIRRRR